MIIEANKMPVQYKTERRRLACEQEHGHLAYDKMEHRHPACVKKEKFTSPYLHPYEKIEVHNRILPHWQQEGVYYFVTWRLADALPAEKLKQWREEKKIWETHHPKPWGFEEKKEYHKHFTQRIFHWLRMGYGSCILRNPSASRIVYNALLHFNGKRYDLDAFVIMPNHVHVLFQIYPNEKLEQVLHSWKSFTALHINRSLHREGETLWMSESWDRMIRDAEHHERVRAYIKRNTEKGIGLYWSVCEK